MTPEVDLWPLKQARKSREQGLGREAVTFAENSHPLRSKDFNTIDKDLWSFVFLNTKHFRYLVRNSNFIIKTHPQTHVQLQ